MGYRTQDLIFTLYGDYILARGGEAWTGAVIDLMSVTGTSSQAIRSTLSRMTRKKRLRSRRVGRHSFHAATTSTKTLLTEGIQRIYHPRHDPWDGRWYILTFSIPESRRHLRDGLRRRLRWLGFGQLGPAVWVAPRDNRREVARAAEELGISESLELFVGDYVGPRDGRALVERCWDVNLLNHAYRDFIEQYRPAWQKLTAENAGSSIGARDSFVQRFVLVHGYRSFPYVDPNLPDELLPDNWLGNDAFHLFESYASLLSPQANKYVDGVLVESPVG